MKTVLCLVLACTLCNAGAREPTRGYNSNASEMSALGAVIVVGGTASMLAESGTAVVESVEKVGEATLVVLKGAKDASKVTLKMSGKVVAGASLAAGSAVSVVTMASGYALVVSGAVIAFIPNEAGKVLLHHSRVSGT
jgi:Cu/Ag efflux protein CusF